MSALQTLFSDERFAYTGPELRPHFLLSRFGLKGSAVASWRGPCQVKTEHMVDWEDRLAKDHIAAGEMVHFLGEFFGATLREGVLLQRLLVALIASRIPGATRSGDDIFVREKKLSVSIVTASPVSQLLHLGINIDPAGAPVPAIGLKELGIEPEPFAKAVLADLAQEWEGIEWACVKVRPVM